MRRLNALGDTIVEVLIAIAVISSVLGGAYASAARSFRGGRQAQERGEALKLAQTQIESLKAIANNANTKDVFNDDGLQTKIFCVDASLNLVLTDKNHASVFPALDSDNTNYGSCQFGTSSRYKLSIQRAADNQTFTIRARWDRFGGGQDEITMVYRVYK